MLNFFTKTLLGQYISVFVISMVPLVELRGAIPFAHGFALTGTGFDLVLGYVLIAIGNMIPVPLIYFFARKILVWGKDKRVIGKFFTFCLEKGEKGGQKLQAKAGQGLFVALLLFVGIPLPGTGAWTGSLIASLLEIKIKKAFPAICLGLVMATVIMCLITYFIPWVISVL
jgi:uncharacterized membrane protein